MYLLFSTGSTSDFYGQLFRPDPFHPASIEVDEEIWEVKKNKQTNKQKKKQTDTERIFSRSIASTVLRLKNLSSIHLFFCWYKFSEDYNQFFTIRHLFSLWSSKFCCKGRFCSDYPWKPHKKQYFYVVFVGVENSWNFRNEVTGFFTQLKYCGCLCPWITWYQKVSGELGNHFEAAKWDTGPEVSCMALEGRRQSGRSRDRGTVLCYHFFRLRPANHVSMFGKLVYRLVYNLRRKARVIGRTFALTF